jgi:hypothetical protein
MAAPPARQLALPGLGESAELVAARARLGELRAAWLAVAHLRESDERERLQPLYFAAVIAVDRLESGPKFWHRG